MEEYKSKIVIIGSGPAGYSAGIYAARAGLNPIMVSGYQKGGQITLAMDIENYPGFPSISGNELMENMHNQAKNVGVDFVEDQIVRVDFSKRPFLLYADSGNKYVADTIIIATGASAKWLGIESEQKYIGFGVSACATCDGFFYRNKDVAVVGGGNTAASEALHLSDFAKSVTLIHRRDALRADKVMQNKLIANPKIKFEWDSVIEEVIGIEDPKTVTGVKLKNVKTNQEKLLNVDGLFVSIGHHPNTDIFMPALKLTDKGYIYVKPNTHETTVKGVFAAGDVINPDFRQAIIAAGSGCMALLEAERFLQLEE